MKIELIYPFFIFAGLIIIGVLLYLRHLSSNAIKAILGLIELNSQLDCDLSSFLSESALLLKTINIDEAFYKIVYLNTNVEKEQSASVKALKKSIRRDDYSISIGIVPRSARGERHYLYLIVLEVLCMLIEMDVLIKIRVINETFYRFSRLQTFILHDAKNLAQFIGSLSYNANRLDSPARSERFIDHLKQSLPMASRRADKIISLLEINKKEGSEAAQQHSIDLGAMLEALANYYKLDFTLTGTATVIADESKMSTIFDALLKNIHDKSFQEPEVHCHMEISEEHEQVRVVISDTGTEINDTNRIFQPFYSTKSGGLGIGLFHARHLLESMQGRIQGRNCQHGVEFEIHIPRQQYLLL